MSNKRAARSQKKAEKSKAKAKSRARHSSRAGTTTGAAGVKTAMRWPIFDCYLSSNWHERGAQVVAAFARKNDNGQVAAAFMEIDLERRGLHTASFRSDLVEGNYGFLLSEKSDNDNPLLSVSPSLVAKVAREGAQWSRNNGHSVPSAWANISQLISDVDVSGQEVDLLFGSAEEEDDPTDEAPKAPGGWFSSLKQRLGRD